MVKKITKKEAEKMLGKSMVAYQTGRIIAYIILLLFVLCLVAIGKFLVTYIL